MHLDEAVGTPQGGPHLPQPCNTTTAERSGRTHRREGPAPPLPGLSPLAMCPGNQEAASRLPKSKRVRNPPDSEHGPEVAAAAARSGPTQRIMTLPVRHFRS